MLEILFVISCSVMFSHTLAYTVQDGYIAFPYFLKYFIAIFWIIVSFFYYVYKNKGRVKKSYFVDISAFILPVYIMICSVVVAILLNPNFNLGYISRSLSNIMVFIITILAVYSSVNLFGFNVIKYCLFGLFLSTVINVIYTSYLYGFENVLKIIIYIIPASFNPYIDGSLEANIGYSLEVSDATFAYGFFIIYYVLFSPPKEKKILGIIISSIGLYLGFKRIEIFSISVVFFVYLFLIKYKQISRKNIQRFLFFIMSIFSIVYLYLMKYQLSFFNSLDRSRVIMYSYLRDLYEFSPLFIGKGYGFVNKWLEEISSKYWIMSVSHSDFVRMFIELGALGFILWLYYYTRFLPNFFYKKLSSNTGNLVLCFVIYIMSTYLIDNTMTLFATQFSFMLIPVALYKYETEKNEGPSNEV